MYRIKITVTLLLLVLMQNIFSQARDYVVHKRGTLHQTVFNTGELGRAYDQANTGSVKGIPSFEWPGNSGTIVEGVAYNGQYHSFGGGIHIGATSPDTIARRFAFCGGAGSNISEVVVGTYSFPLKLERVENYPVLTNGQLNPTYNPDEAEEIITSQWATPTGLTVTRISRAWSQPDYDDFIIYEYEIENTGNRDGNPTTIESNVDLKDVLIAFAYGLTPSMFGYERNYNRWNYTDFENHDLRARFDRNRWLNYAIDRTGKPDIKFFTDWANNQVNGGGLLSPQAVGFLPLYYDTTHLAKKGETQIQVRSSDTINIWDANLHVKQPFLNRLETSNLRISKIQPYIDIGQARKNNPYSNTAIFGTDWIGRGSFNVRQSMYFGVGRILAFGPYNIKFGEKVRFAIAEVAGYGAARKSETDAGLKDEGGSCGQNCGEDASLAAFNPVPNWSDTISINGIVYGSKYLSSYSLPQYINSNTVTVREVADRAIEAYSGVPYLDHDSIAFWPERSPDKGVYKFPLLVPNPILEIRSNSKAQNVISWINSVESYTSNRLSSPLRYYEVYRSGDANGPWTRLDSIGINDTRFFDNGRYTVIDSTTKVSESFYYSVVTVHQNGERNSKSNSKPVKTYLGAEKSLSKVVVVPNPFIIRSGFMGVSALADANSKITFFQLPTVCTIRIYSYSGQLIETLEHNEDSNSHDWYQVTRNNQKIAPGLYFFVVSAPDGKTTSGKFVVIR